MSKAQQKREAAYRKQLRNCGFRSWKAANAARAELINIKVARNADGVDLAELEQLQKLAGLYAQWKTNDMLGRAIRRLKRLQKKLGAKA